MTVDTFVRVVTFQVKLIVEYQICGLCSTILLLVFAYEKQIRCMPVLIFQLFLSLTFQHLNIDGSLLNS